MDEKDIHDRDVEMLQQSDGMIIVAITSTLRAWRSNVATGLGGL